MNATSVDEPQSPTEVPVLIVGAGPTGLVLALWLTRLGVRVRIIDKTAEPGTTSRALAVQARTLEFYRQVGLADAAVAGGVQVEHLNFWARGKRAVRVPLSRIGEGLSRYCFALVFPQDAHERLLVERLDSLGVKVERQTELLRFEQLGSGVRATLKRPDGSEEVCEAAYLAGCDGASSTVRQQLGIGFPGGTYTGVFYVADVDAAGSTADRELHVDFEDADFVLVLPLQGDGRLRLVGPTHDVPGGDHHKLSFANVEAKAVEHLKLAIAKVNWFSTYRVHHRVADRFRVDRIFLLGDAAHVHSPVGGQGMNTGIGDAVNLAWKLAAVLKGDASDSLLESYEPERIGFARRLVATTDQVFKLVSKRGAVARFVRTRVVPRVIAMLFRLPLWRRWMFKTLSQIGINYPDSPLSEGTAGSVRGGDRLPWVALGTDGDNFAPLGSVAWQVHVYGEAQPGPAEACTELGLPLHAFAWQPDMERAGLKRAAVYLVRPDGYVALADSTGGGERLRSYFAARGLRTTAPRR